MPIKRIDDFPEGSGSLSNDDVFLFMDDPSGTGVTKKISLSQISSAIGGGPGGNPFDQDLNTNDSPTFDHIIISGTKIFGGGENSGDGNGYGTLELIPDSGLYSNDQYLIIDPTGPNHVHIRAGGTIDNSNAEIIVGGEKNNLRVNDQSPLTRLQTESLITSNTYYFTSPSPDFSSAVWETVGGNNRVVINDPASIVYDAVWAFTSDSVFTVVDSDGNSHVLTRNGSSTPGGSSPVIVYVAEAPLANPTALIQLVFEIKEIRRAFLEANGTDVRIEADDDVRIYSHDTFRLYNYSSNDPIEIITDYDDQDYTWTFNSDGTLDLPEGKAVNWGQNINTLGPPVASGNTDRIRLWDFQGSGSNFNYAIGAENNHVWFSMDVNDGTGGFKFYSRDNEIFKISDDSKLVFPNGTTVATGTYDNGYGGSNGISLNCSVGYELNWQAGHLKCTQDNGLTSENILADSAIEFPGSGIDNMQIDSSGIIFSDSTIQTTAYNPKLYASFYDTTTQTNVSSTGVNIISYNSTAISSGISITSGDRITFSKNSHYNIQFSLQFEKTDSGDDVVDLWISKTGSYEPWSNTSVSVLGNNGRAVAAWNFVVQANSGDYYQLHWYSADSSMKLLAQTGLANPTRPDIPSVILTAIEI